MPPAVSFAIALVHHPVLDRHGDVVTTAVTNLDIHDLARLARTYEARAYFVVTPIAAQRDLVQRVVGHWKPGRGHDAPGTIPSSGDRGQALRLVRVAASLDLAAAAFEAQEGSAPLLVATAARARRGAIDFEAWAEAAREPRPLLVVFGTGHGLAESVLARCDATLAPIRPAADYNHLSVRTAAAIVIDRLFGDAPATRPRFDIPPAVV